MLSHDTKVSFGLKSWIYREAVACTWYLTFHCVIPFRLLMEWLLKTKTSSRKVIEAKKFHWRKKSWFLCEESSWRNKFGFKCCFFDNFILPLSNTFLFQSQSVRARFYRRPKNNFSSVKCVFNMKTYSCISTVPHGSEWSKWASPWVEWGSAAKRSATEQVSRVSGVSGASK